MFYYVIVFINKLCMYYEKYYAAYFHEKLLSYNFDINIVIKFNHINHSILLLTTLNLFFLYINNYFHIKRRGPPVNLHLYVY